MDTLNVLTELSNDRDLEGAVAWILSDALLEPANQFIERLLDFGCESSMITSVSYDLDTDIFFDKHY